MTRRSTRWMAAAGAWLLFGCGTTDPAEPPLFTVGQRGPAVLAFYGDTSEVQLATSTRVGEAATVRFTSFAGGCIRQDSTETDVAGLEAEVRPYRREPASNTVCPSILRVDQNVIEIRFTEPGRARVRIVGLARPGDFPFVLEREVLVTP